MRRIFMASIAAMLACESPDNGAGTVEGEIFVSECRPSGDLAPGPYRFEAGHLATRRFENSLMIVLQEFKVEVEESDGFVIRIPDVRALRADTAADIDRPVSRDPEAINAALSLFQTCPDRPTLHVSAGVLSLDEFSIAADPEDTGERENILGTLTGSVAAADGRPAGQIRAWFRFLPPDRSVSEPQ